MSEGRSMSRVRRGALAISVGAALVLVAGCGQGGEDLANGKTQFSAACGGCHALEDAGTKGAIGPDLDDAFRGSRQQGFEQSSFQGLVHRWISFSQPPMPRNLVTGQDAEDVAAYVASVAGTSENSQPRVAQPPPPEATPVTFIQDTPPDQQGGD
jgi:mono/diheme cytochrome c family protein